MENIRAYKDGNRLVIVIEDTNLQLEEFIKGVIIGALKPVEHLEHPEPMAVPKLVTQDLQPLTPNHREPPRFVQQAQQEQEINVGGEKARAEKNAAVCATSNVQTELEKVPNLIPGKIPQQTPPSSEKRNMSATYSIPRETPESELPGTVEKTERKLDEPLKKPGYSIVQVRCMQIFELREFLKGNRSNQKLSKLLIEHFHTTNLDYVLSVKPEREIREIATLLAG